MKKKKYTENTNYFTYNAKRRAYEIQKRKKKKSITLIKLDT